MIGFDPVVGPAFDVMPRRRDQFVEHPWVDLSRVGDNLGRSDLQCDQRSAEEPAGGVGVPSGRDQHVDDLSMLVDGPVDVAPDTVDLDIGLVNEPAIAWRVPAGPGGVSKQRCEPMDPPVDGDVVNLDARSASSSSTSR